MSNPTSNLNFEYAEHSSSGIRSSKSSHQRGISYAIRSNETITLAVMTEPVWPPDGLEAKLNSQTVLDTVFDTFFNSTSATLCERFRTSFKLAAERIHVDEITDLIPIVCVAVVITNELLHVASCGHCRVFLIRDGIARQINVAHTFAEALIEIGELTPEEFVGSHITRPGPVRCIGFGEEDMRCDMRLRLSSEKEPNTLQIKEQGVVLQTGDTLIITSGFMYWDWMLKEDWQTLENNFKHIDQNLQSLVDQFAAQVLYQRSEEKDIGIMALRMTNAAPAKTPIC